MKKTRDEIKVLISSKYEGETKKNIRFSKPKKENGIYALIMESRGTLDSAGFSVAYAIIEKVCDKYVNNGFLSDTVIDETPYPAYEIRMPASYTAEQINKRQFPDIALLICGRNFVNQVTVNISNAY